MNIQTRKSISDDLEKYCYCADDKSFIEVTEWANGEGYDILIESHGSSKTISITHGELDAINYLTMSLDYQK